MITTKELVNHILESIPFKVDKSNISNNPFTAVNYLMNYINKEVENLSTVCDIEKEQVKLQAKVITLKRLGFTSTEVEQETKLGLSVERVSQYKDDTSLTGRLLALLVGAIPTVKEESYEDELEHVGRNITRGLQELGTVDVMGESMDEGDGLSQ